MAPEQGVLARVRPGRGAPAALISGYFRGELDRVLVLLMDSRIALPHLLIEFEPGLLPEGEVSVACHLYDEEATERARSAASSSQSGRPSNDT